MRNIIIIPDSFKGTMSSARICREVKDTFLRHWPDAKITTIPVADGGEGSVDAFLEALGGEKIFVEVKGPYGEVLESYYGLLSDGTAVVEMAAAAGLPLVGDNKQAEKTTTFGVGQLMLAAAKSGCKKLIVGLGGSATNDGGCGAACACGVKFYDKNGVAFVPVGETLAEIAKIDDEGLDPSLKKIELVTMCDIDNPLCGPQGAAAVFGPQKGASPACVAMLDAGLEHLAEVVKKDLGKEIRELSGAGAAGGMGGGMAAFFHSRLQPGITTVLEAVRFDELLKDADLVITGEGKIDTQSLRGKVVIGVARAAKAAGVPTVALVGDIGDGVLPAYDEGLIGIFSINRVAVPYAIAKERALSDLSLTADNLARFMKALGR